jgi:hypothetical protein
MEFGGIERKLAAVPLDECFQVVRRDAEHSAEAVGA